MMEAIGSLEKLENEVCRIPLIFSEMLKDEVNANDEQEIYQNVIAFLKKHRDNKEVIAAVNEFTSAVTGGASMTEILNITRDEAVSPTLASKLTVDDTCSIDESRK